MNTARKGRRGEHRARKALEAAGYRVVRAAGSKGPIDLVAFAAAGLILVQVKSGLARLSRRERLALQLLPRPAGARVECWRYVDGCRAPAIERL